MCETQHNNADLDYFKNLNLQEISRSLVHFRESHVCANRLDVQETNFSFTQHYWSGNYFSGCSITYGWVICSRSLGHIDWSTTFNQQHCPTQILKHPGNWRDSPFPNPDTKCQNNEHVSAVDRVFADTFFSRWVSMVHFEDHEVKKISMDEVQRWDTTKSNMWDTMDDALTNEPQPQLTQDSRTGLVRKTGWVMENKFALDDKTKFANFTLDGVKLLFVHRKEKGKGRKLMRPRVLINPPKGWRSSFFHHECKFFFFEFGPITSIREC